MAIDSSFVLEALLKHNYLPVQKKNKDEMPPIFSTEGLTKDIAEEIKNIKPQSQGKFHTLGPRKFPSRNKKII